MDSSTLLSTLGLVFVAELGDKTQLAVITQTCKYRKPWAVFLGASTALTGVTALGAIGGHILGQFICERVLDIVAALAFVVMGCLIIREDLKAEEKTLKDVGGCVEGMDCRVTTAWDWKAFSSTCGLLFVAELGDKTQLAVLSLASKRAEVWSIFIGGALALTLVTALGVVGGQGLCKLMHRRLLLWISAIAFMVTGILIGLGVM